VKNSLSADQAYLQTLYTKP